MTTGLAQLVEIADILRQRGHPQSPALDAAIAEVEAGRRDIGSIHVTLDLRLDKFDGDVEAGKSPVETIRRREDMLTGETIR